ncbi:F-box domain containing protein [Trichomonas vaginalis G3]|uniref:F-box domain containing protein n=1 Tax=Trichomonas vaginalis (strain ATCC PRA-98 / G3) TaxID=412133 RepID=A2FRN6_TRIV3|nr:saposin family [Trichomonas vaginalis G3]EAX92415.1 F-box domain containing protein [Trichomonas vaginalis G3]KAI5510496.1 saposin family [Trichomonas vaginalis G3]|eukprot:XP_001305345.1 F-box domain containing protein [Trichomonas vaginalis G3]
MFFNLFILISSEQNKCEECERAFKKIIHKGNFNIKDREFPFCKGNQKCNSLSNTVHKKILQHISPRDYCSSIKLCRPTASSLSMKPRKSASEISFHDAEDNCKFCTDFFEWYLNEGIEDSMVPLVQKMFQALCDLVGSSDTFEHMCEVLKKKNYAPVAIRNFFNLLRAKFDNQELCARMALCPSL